MFELLNAVPPDPIMGLTEAFKNDPNPDKINLGVGVYKDSQGATPILATVKEAERRLIDSEKTKSYLGIDGSPEFAQAVQELIFGLEHPLVRGHRVVTAQTPGGTAALRVAADLIKQKFPETTVWLSDPTWANHHSIFTAAGLAVRKYAYYSAETKDVDFERMVDSLKEVPASDVVVLHGCCHNPTGADPDLNQWKVLEEVIEERGWLPIIDFAYQGFADGIEEDAQGLLQLLTPGCEAIICSSFSKNFGIYCERVGALSAIGSTAEATQIVHGHIKRSIRANYSNPPYHGAAIVSIILNDPELRRQWEGEVDEMRDRIGLMRELFVKTLKEKGVKHDFSFLAEQRGMFSFSGLTKEHVAALKERYAIYIVDNGRINVAGMTESNMDYLCMAIANVLQEG